MFHRLYAYLILVASASLLVSCGGSGSGDTTTPPPTVSVALAPFVSGLVNPTGFVAANDGSGRFFVLEQRGTIRIIQSGALVSTPFLDIQSKVASGGEEGLLGLGLHPNFAQNRRFFLNYTQMAGTQLQSVVSEFAASATNPNQADPTSERVLLTLNQPFSNHNGGQLAFGPDGYLYIGFGDGGSGGDPLGNGQNLQTLFGKILRIDVNGAQPYAIPADNPYANGLNGRAEIWAYGFRNPWRFSFDQNGRLFVGDVGQDNYEEVDVVSRGGNYGWNIMEGGHCYSPATGCSSSGLSLPIIEYDHSLGEGVIGGYVYTGTAIPSLAGNYIFGDLASGRIWMAHESPPGSWTAAQIISGGPAISSFGQDTAGEIYVLDYSGGNVLKLVAK
jgi:glucose/arabinose dehydrogenase